MADNLYSEFKEHSVAEFFKKNRQMLGFSSKIRSLTTAVHEYITNSLDACEEHGILPEVFVEIEQLGEDHYKVTVEDNGPGLPKKLVGKAFGQMLAGTKFHRYIQQRGQQGIGATGATLYSQVTTGKPVKVRTSMGNGKIYECTLVVDTKQNAPKIESEHEFNGAYRGTRVEAEFKDVNYNKSEYGAFEYIRRTAMANPHAKITFIDPLKEKIVFDRVSDKIPERPRAVLPHPLGVATDDLITMARITQARKLSSFLQQEFSRVSSAKIDELRQLVPTIDMGKNPHALQWEEAEAITKAFKTMRWIAPEMTALRPIGAGYVEKSLQNVVKPEFVAVIERPPKVFRGGVPFLMEAAIVYGGAAGKPAEEGRKAEILRFANRAPLLFDAGGCALHNVVKNVDWNRYGVKDFENQPISVFLHMVSVHIPYTSAGKQAVADEDEILKEAHFAVMEVARHLQRHLSGVRRKGESERKRKEFDKYIPFTAAAIAKLTGKEPMTMEDLSKLASKEGKVLEEKLAKIVNERFHEVIEETDEEELESNGGNGESEKVESGGGEDA